MVTIKSENEIKILAEGGHLLALILRKLVKMVEPGLHTAELERVALKEMEIIGARPSFKDYDMGSDLVFPTALCISINNEVVHGTALPDRILKGGDIVDIDIGMEYKGLYTDTCVTTGVGKISMEAKKLIKITRRSLEMALKKVKAGNTINDIGLAVEDFIRPYKYGIVKDLVGHGVGYAAHEEPHVFNYAIGANSPDNLVLKAGMVLAVEPMINIGTWRVKTASNGYTILTADGSLSAHFEHTVVVTDKGCKILTT